MSHDLKISARAERTLTKTQNTFQIQGGSKLEVFDNDGKLIHQGEFKSFTSNFLKLLYGSMVGAGTAKAKDLSGNNIEMDSFPQCTMNMEGGSGNYRFGVVVGTGDSAVGVNEYTLVSPATGLNYNDTVIGSPSVGSTSVSLEISRQISNATGSTVTLKEAGLICGAEGGTTENALVARDLLNVTLENGKKSIWRYTINFNFTAQNGGFVKNFCDYYSIFSPWKTIDSANSRCNYVALEYKDRWWSLGGFGSSNQYFNDVRYSEDLGETWVTATNSAPWEQRDQFSGCVFNDKMWIMGGINSRGGLFNDVWYSTDGITWTRATSSAAWSARRGFTTVVYDGKMWVMGGTDSSNTRLNSVYSSSDGVNWINEGDAPWTPRRYHMALTLNNKIWIFGGDTQQGAALSDIWCYDSQSGWTQINQTQSMSPRRQGNAFELNGTMYLIYGGSVSGLLTAVEASSDGGISWHKVFDVPTERKGLDLFVKDKNILGWGGQDSSNAILNSTDSTHTNNIGIIPGSSDSTFSATATALGSLIADGTGMGQLVYGNMPDASTTEPSVTGNKTKFSLAREFTNSSGADVTIREVGLFSGSTMLARLILTNPITLVDGESEIVTIDFETEV